MAQLSAPLRVSHPPIAPARCRATLRNWRNGAPEVATTARLRRVWQEDSQPPGQTHAKPTAAPFPPAPKISHERVEADLAFYHQPPERDLFDERSAEKTRESTVARIVGSAIARHSGLSLS